MSTRNPKDRVVIGTINKLGWDLLIHFCTDDNSPYSNSTLVSGLSTFSALTMLAGAAVDPKQREMCAKLGAGSLRDLQATYPGMRRMLESDNVFHSANGLVAETQVCLSPQYQDYLRRLMVDANLHFLNLADSVAEINKWISRTTKRRIPSLLTADDLRDSAVALINALIFAAAFAEPFRPRDTVRCAPFYPTIKNGSRATATVDMMYRHGKGVLVYQGERCTAVRLPYRCTPPSEWSMIACLPNKDTPIQEMLQILRTRRIPSFAQHRVGRLGLPRFELQVQHKLNSTLQALGFPIDGSFPALDMGGDTQVGNIVQSLSLECNEKGTVAAVATAVIIGRGGPPPYIPELIFDRPFVFAIVADELDLAICTGLFSGQ
ncbi:hypothetical protein ASPACDRAFT_61911 [Aspergillus aculeatus ATCC 16872]|uniref:Serpin domain-containing protein n=1 Tax=Aspergillus aculeatus (strain ATCC 16872 / CBS 172.66 / WB 5094) TaxID=690307 RepID=A0A1L9WQI5_ASPA1|nr:uncharacterized protein ASPACDRAFT_61911 [Aspergillus aculeatus ATCC 16872]OJJ98400.1 hypothetical protein ASPACDRAFT_61911 [Aspergillus aculeatus ATCC 16872]